MSQRWGEWSLQQRRFAILVLYLLVASPWLLRGTFRALESASNSPLEWVDDGFAPRRDFDRFVEQFGARDQLVISWPGCTVDERRTDLLVKVLRHSGVFQDQRNWLFEEVVFGREAFRSLQEPPLSLSPAEATARLRGALVGPDGRTTCLIIRFSPEGLRRRARLVPSVMAAAVRYGGARFEELHLAGPIMDGYSVDVASQTTMHRLAPLSSLVVFVFCILCFDSLYAALLVFGVSLISQAISLAMLHYCGVSMTALLIVLPPLVQVLSVAGGIHWINYYLDLAAVDDRDVIGRTMRAAWLPCSLSSGTTAIGLGSLGVSGLVAVRDFGVYAAIAVLITLAALLAILPGPLAWVPLRPRPHAVASRAHNFWGGLALLQQRFAVWVLLAGAVLMLGLGWGVTRLTASVRIETLFSSDSKLIRDYRWLEEHVAPLVPIDVVVTFDPAFAAAAKNKFAILQRVQQTVESQREVQHVSSPFDFLPAEPVPDDPRVQAVVLERLRPVLQAKRMLATDARLNESWRMTAHLSALADHQYGDILEQLRTVIRAEVDQATGMSPNCRVSLSGLMPLVHEIQRQLLRDLFVSFMTAFGLILIVMTLVQAGIVSGLLSMIPNVFPALLLFGGMGWAGHPLDIGSIMTASIAMGIAVDDTLHFLTFFQSKLEAGVSRFDAVQAAYRQCGRAMLQTTVVCGCGLAIFGLSDFVPTARFAWMMVSLLFAAIVGDLVLLPAIILSPMGRVFRQRDEAA